MAQLPTLDPGVRRVDVTGNWMLPGFIDCHVHLSNADAERDPLRRATLPNSYLHLSMVQSARVTLQAGVTTVRDLGGADLGMKMAVEQGIIDGPRMLIAVTPISVTGGHGDACYPSGLDLGFRSQYPGIADGEVECRKRTREMLRAGADVIKIHATGGVWSPRDQPDDEGLTIPEITAVVDEAQRHRGKRVAAHAQGRGGIANAVLGGVTSVEHGYEIDEATVEEMIKRGTYLVPTLTTATTVPDKQAVPLVSYEKKMKWIEVARSCLPKALTSGVRIAMGTDCGVAAHGRNLTELRRLVEFGVSPMEALLAGTQYAAELIDRSDELGSLAVGKFGDVVVTDCDPLQQIDQLENANHIVMVVKEGVVYKDLVSQAR
ncbi:amidohydrolase family protein [Ferrimicrobium sp.]|uniref:metal-dependent hydrolase family protein n=1 Tax=Ferrimicrobium sp. TaxID=2926050 RepID=UPI00260B8574|nr:amidohydrolase family protein [Ferrimicrobium sp.]